MGKNSKNNYEIELPKSIASKLAAASTGTAGGTNGTNSTNPNNPKGINPKGIVKQTQTEAKPAAPAVQTGTAPAAPTNAAPAVAAAAQALAQASSGTQTAAQTTTPAATTVSRPETAAYSASQEVQNALAALNNIVNNQPGAYQQSQAVTNAYNALMNAQNNKPGAYQQSQDVTDAYAALLAAQNAQPGDYTEGQRAQAAYAAMQALQAAQPGAYQQSQAVTDAYNALMNLQNNQPGTYTPSQNVLNAQAALQNLQTNKPQGYNSKYQPQLDSLLQQIQNPGQFNYEFNGDNLFKQYADQYTQRGKQASLDAMGQAAALTGGYGNSYAQQVGNQAYDQYLTQLYDKGLELRDRAYQQWLDDQNRNMDIYGLLNQADQNEYNRYRDTVGDWKDERGYLTDVYNNERNVDYNMFRDAVGDWQNNRNFAADLYNTERNYDYNAYQDMLNTWMNNRNYATDLYNTEANRSYNEYRDKVGDWQNNRNYSADRYDTERSIDYNKYRDEVGDWQNTRNFMADMYNNERNYDYSQYRDLMNDWMANREWATNQYNQLSNTDYSRYADARDLAEKQYQYDAGLAQDMLQFNENVRQFNASLDWDKMSSEQKYAAEYAMQILANGQMPSADMLQAAGLSEEDAQKMLAVLTAGGSGTGGGKKQTYIMGTDGKYYKSDEKGNLITDKDGKAKGVTEDQLPSNVVLDSKPSIAAINQLSGQKTSEENYKAGNAFANVAEYMDKYYPKKK